MALTARPSHPGLGAARAQGAGLAAPGRRAGWPRSTRAQGRVSCVPAHGQHQHTASTRAVCRVCQHTASHHTASTPSMSSGLSVLRLCASSCVCVVWSCVPSFSNRSRAPNVDSYTIHTVIIYSIYIPIKSSKYMTHMTHQRGFSEGQITSAQMPTTPHTPTHTH